MKKLLLTLFLLSACDDASSVGSLNFGASGNSSSSPSASAGAYAYLEVYAATVSGSNVGSYVRISTCEIPTGSLVTDYDCPTVSYDEGLLYNSRLKFKWGTKDKAACPFLKFYPYYYRASNSAAFAPEWLEGSTVDCSDPENNDSKDCYGGVAPLVSSDLNFPISDSFFSPTSVSMTGEIEVDAGVELSRFSNRTVANPASTYVIGGTRTMADGSDGIVNAFAGLYTGNLAVLRPYKVVCEDSNSDPIYTLNFYLSDYDVSGSQNQADDPNFNDYPDWDSSLNTLDPQL